MLRPKLIVIDISPALAGLNHLDARLQRDLILNVFDELLNEHACIGVGPANVPRVNPRLIRNPSIAALEQLQACFASAYFSTILILTEYGIHQLVDETGSLDYAVKEVDLSGRLLLQRFEPEETVGHLKSDDGHSKW